MPSKKLLTYLNVLSQNELRKLEKFIQSPYHNEVKDLSRFYAIIKPHLLKKEEVPVPSKQEIWKKLFPNTKYNDTKLRKIASLVLQLAIEFKAYEILKQKPEQKLLLELHAVSQPELTTHIAGINRKLIHYTQQNSINTIESNFYRFRLSIQNHRIAEMENDRKKLLKLEELQEALEHLDVFYYAQKLAMMADNIGYQGFMNIAHQFHNTQKLFEEIESSPFFNKPIIQVYYLIIQMLSQPEQETHFFKLKDWLNQNSQHFDKSQKKTFYSHLINYCISHKINKGDETFYQYAFNVFKIMVEQQLIFTPFMEPSYYRNIISIGLRVKEFDYVQNFIHTYSKYLPPNQKENAATFNLASLYYKQKNYGKVLELLHNVELTNLSYALGAKTILVGTYYAMDEYRALESLLTSFRIFILRNKLLAKSTKQSYLNFLKFTKKLISLAPYDHKGKEKLQQTILKTQNVAVRDWLLEQINR